MAINFEEVSFTYQAGTPFATSGLHDVNLHIPEHAFTAVIGHTGSGKSTMVQMLDGLTQPTTGTVTVGEHVVTSATKKKVLNDMREHIGMVFQFPEAQLFEQTVLQDVMFGPMNYGMSEEDAKVAAKEALRTVGMAERFDDRTPFDLSGGQMRRVAIAGILAMQPDLLILDEPTAGLDPAGQTELMALFGRLQAERNLTVVLITHQMEFVAEYASHVIVFEGGTVLKEGTTRDIFSDSAWLKEHQLDVPAAQQFADALATKGIHLNQVLDMDALADELVKELQGGAHG